MVPIPQSFPRVYFLPVAPICSIDWFIRRQVPLSVYLELSSNRRLKAACLLLVIFGVHVTKFSIKFQHCAFSLQNPEQLSSQSRGFIPCLPRTVLRYLPANLSTFRESDGSQIWLGLSLSLCLSLIPKPIGSRLSNNQ